MYSHFEKASWSDSVEQNGVIDFDYIILLAVPSPGHDNITPT